MPGWWAAFAVWGALSGAAADPVAVPPPPTSETEGSGDGVGVEQELFERVGQLNNEAQDHFERAEYADAIAKWDEALALTGDANQLESFRTVTIYQLAQAHLLAYELGRDDAQLRMARLRLEQFVERTGAHAPEARAAREQLVATEAELQRLDAAQPPPAPAPVVDPVPEPRPPIVADIPNWTRRERALLGSGIATAALGVGALGALTYGLVAGSRADDDGAAAVAAGADPQTLQALRRDGERANGVAIGAGVAAGVLVAASVALTTSALVLRRHRTRAAMSRRDFGLGVRF